MISVNDFRTGATIEVDGEIFSVMEFQHVKPGKGAAFVRSKLRNLRNNNIVDKTFRAGETVKRAHIESRAMQYLYASGNEHTFMDLETYDQITIPASRLEWELKFIVENATVNISSYQGEILGVNLPANVELEVTETEAAVRGNTAQGATKTAVLETGHSIQVPMFINVGDRLLIDTRDGKYVSRA